MSRMKGRSGPPLHQHKQVHGLTAMRRIIRKLGGRAIDHRTRAGKALVAMRSAILDDLGGESAVTAAQLAVVEEVVVTKFLLASINVWLVQQNSLLAADGQSVLPVVLERQRLADSLTAALARATSHLSPNRFALIPYSRTVVTFL
ncbi:MAG: hypothetical protein ACRD1X_00880 [Vicinamibacteria bacterium]